jgi:Mce-associated membrane protein
MPQLHIKDDAAEIEERDKLREAVEPAEVEATAGVDEADEADEGIRENRGKSAKSERRSISISIRALLVGAVIIGLLAAAGVTTWLYLGAKAQLDAQARQAAATSRAEQIALDYAVGAAKIDAKDLGPWKTELVKGTTPELKDKLSNAATSMEQILVPLQWNSTAVPLVAKVRSDDNGTYVVDTFVSVQTKTVQAPEGLESTATYSITIDSNHDWQISEVGGVGAVVGQK